MKGMRYLKLELFLIEEIVKQREVLNTKQEGHTLQRIGSTIFGVIEVVLAFRLVFKLLGANPDNGFVQAIYAFSQIFAGMFVGIFFKVTTQGAGTTGLLSRQPCLRWWLSS